MKDEFAFSMGELKSFNILKQTETYEIVKEMTKTLMLKSTNLIILVKKVARENNNIDESKKLDKKINALRFEINLIKKKIENYKSR